MEPDPPEAGTTNPSRVTRDALVPALRVLGVAPGECVLVHSSLSRFGHVDKGADAVIDALLDALGPEGTLAMPALCQKDRERRFETWDLQRSPSDVGHITETFRLRPRVLRSDHATHSVAAAGPLAEALTRGHGSAHGRPGPWGGAAFADGSPWQALYRCGARIVFLGVDFHVNTMGHFIEHLVAERAAQRAPEERRPAMLASLQGWCKPGVWPAVDRIRLQAELDAIGMLAWARCGGATLLAVPARPMVDYALRVIEADPESWYRSEVCAWLKGEPAA